MPFVPSFSMVVNGFRASFQEKLLKVQVGPVFLTPGSWGFGPQFCIDIIRSHQIIATSRDLTPKGSEKRKSPYFMEIYVEIFQFGQIR